MHLVYSCELELNFSAIKGNLNGINPEMSCSNFGNVWVALHIHRTKGQVFHCLRASPLNN
jgi:hypothetical protein